MKAKLLLAAVLAGAFSAVVRPVTAPFVPLQIKPTWDAEFPPDAFTLGFNRGEALVIVAVNASGRLTDSLVVRSSHPSFGAAALQALRHWQYGPARWRGGAVAATRAIAFHFKHSSGAVVIQSLPDHLEARLRGVEPNTYLYRSYNLPELDQEPAAVARAAPAYPEELRRAGVHGTVNVTFYIDEQGQTRFPEVTQAASAALADLTVAAVGRWRFAPAQRQGRPVLVRVSQEIRFGVSPVPTARGQ